MINPEAQYRQLSKNNLDVSREIREICAPLLQHTNVKTFVYVRMYNDGSRAYFSNHASWINHYFSKHYFGDIDHTSYYYTDNDEGEFCLWSGLEKDEILKAAFMHNIWHGIIYREKYLEYRSACIFASTQEDSQIVNFYLNNLSLLKKFALYFSDKIDTLLERKSSNFILPLKILTPPEKLPSFFSNEKQAFLEGVKIKRYNLDDSSFLTARELECVRWCANGKSAEEIAIILGIAKRTVEIHLTNCKHRLECYKISHLVKKLINLGLID